MHQDGGDRVQLQRPFDNLARVDRQVVRDVLRLFPFRD
jgi:hypothetical protein